MNQHSMTKRSYLKPTFGNSVRLTAVTAQQIVSGVVPN